MKKLFRGKKEKFLTSEGRVTIRKEGNHYIVSIGGTGMYLAKNKREAIKYANSLRRQLGRKIRR